MLGMRPPQYVRAINFTNSSNGTIVVSCSHQSGEFTNIELSANATQTVEREIDHGSWTAVDPILSFSATGNNLAHQSVLAPQGVEIHNVNILDINGNLTVLSSTN
jgi:hypothetical protein